MDGRLGLRSRFFRSAAGLAALFVVGATAGGCTAMRRYDPVMKGYIDCDGGQCGSGWHRYDTVMKGRNDCEDGRCGACSSCKPACAPAPCAAPCAPAPCAPAPCARPCAVAPCAAEGMPPAAKPGEAWCRVTTPAQYKTVSETVCSQCAGCRRLWVPPVTETRFREVCVTPACSCEVDVPGVTRTVRTCETVCPARTETRKVDCATGNGCGCPPQDCYATVEVPAQTRTVAHEVCIQAPSKRVKYSPPRYRTEAVVCEIQPGRWETVQTPAVYETVTRQVCVAPEQTSWKKNEACMVPQPAPTPCSPMPVAPTVAAPAVVPPAVVAPAPAAPAPAVVAPAAR